MPAVDAGQLREPATAAARGKGGTAAFHRQRAGCWLRPQAVSRPAAESSVAGHHLYRSRPSRQLYEAPDLAWNGTTIPLDDASVDCVLLTEVLEHCHDPDAVLAEVARALRPGGFLFLTVPFIWPMHTVPHDEFRYTPFALRRLLLRAGFEPGAIEATGGRHAVLALTLGLWVRRRPLTSRMHVVTKGVMSILLWPVICLLLKIDRRPAQFEESTLIVGLAASAFKRP